MIPGTSNRKLAAASAWAGAAFPIPGAGYLRSASGRLHAGRLMWLGLVALVCAAIGVVDGVDPKLGVLVPIGIAFSVAVLWNVTVGLFLFTVLAWLHTVTHGSAAVSGAKAAGLLVFLSWFAARSIRPDPNARPLSEAQPGLVVAAVALGTWSAMSIVWAHNRGIAVTETYSLVLEMLLFPIAFYAIRRREHLVWILGAFVLGAFVSAVVGLGQSGSRQVGAVGDADSEGILLATSLILLTGFLASLPPGSRLKRWGWPAALIMLAGLINAGSRSGLVALACGLAAGACFGGRWRSKAIAALLVAAGATGLYITTLAPRAAATHLSGSGSTGRTDLWRIGLRVWEANPIIGVGAGNFSAVSVDYVQQLDSITFGPLIVAQKPKPAHNTYLELLDDLGIPGLIGFLVIVVASISAALKAARIYERLGDTRTEVMSRCVALAIIAQLSGAFFITDISEKLLWLLLALPLPLLAIAKAEAQLPQPG
jgi:O-antigen ligase